MKKSLGAFNIGGSRRKGSINLKVEIWQNEEEREKRLEENEQMCI